MSLEQALQENTEALRALHAVLSSGATLNASGTQAAGLANTPAPAPAAEKPAKATKEKKAEAPAPSPAPAAEPEKQAAGPDFDKDVLPVILEINKSTEPGRGRDGVIAVVKKFITLKEGEKPNVKALGALGKNAEILAYAKEVLAGPAAAEEEDDLGI